MKVTVERDPPRKTPVKLVTVELAPGEARDIQAGLSVLLEDKNKDMYPTTSKFLQLLTNEL